MTTNPYFDIVIVGAGHAGAQVAIALRQQGFSGSIALIGNESELPYERPPLSKEYLAGDKSFDRMHLRPETFWNEKHIQLILNTHVDDIDAKAHRIVAGDQIITYGQLIWAAGGSPRRITIAGSDLSGILTVRTKHDADAMLAAATTATDVVVIGGGYIGLEAAATFTKMGKRVTLLETLPRLLSRVAGETLSRFFEAEHRNFGVDVRLNVQVDSFVGDDGQLTGVTLADGDLIKAQLCIVGIGIIPCIAPLEKAGAVCSNGVDVDEFCHTSLTDIFAIGDCAAHENIFAGGQRMRVESVQNANDQANTVARFITGKAEPYRATPWFWSNQYDLKLQTVGISAGFDDTVIRGDPDSRSFSIIYLKDGRVIALDCINATKDYVQGRKLVEQAIPADRSKLMDINIPLKDLMPSSQ